MKTKAFTLVELLVVMTIIAILAGIISPMFYSAKERVREAKAKATAKGLEAAFRAYLDYYKVWPQAWLAGDISPIEGKVFYALQGIKDDTINKDGIVFFDFENLTNSMDAHTAYDPWSNPSDSTKWSPYYVAFDKDFDNLIKFGPDIKVFRPVVVWSIGKDRRQDYGENDDVTSWK